jgi:polyhydroxybutyrate depolymerase
VVVFSVCACTEDDKSTVDAALPDATVVAIDAGVDASPSLLDMRPYKAVAPTSYDGSKALPLVLVLPGYGGNASVYDGWWKLGKMAETKQFFYVSLNGTRDLEGKTFWNATDACCNFDGSKVDDVAYLDAVIEDMQAKYKVDAARIYLIGHSNGGFMSYRYACDRAAKVAAIVSLAGATWLDSAKCPAGSVVSVLQVHGDADTTIPYLGGSTDVAPFPSAKDSVAAWAAKNGCTGALEASETRLDLDANVAGIETRVERYAGCPSTSAVELWTIEGGAHIPNLGSLWTESVYTFLSSHAK